MRESPRNLENVQTRGGAKGAVRLCVSHVHSVLEREGRARERDP